MEIDGTNCGAVVCAVVGDVGEGSCRTIVLSAEKDDLASRIAECLTAVVGCHMAEGTDGTGEAMGKVGGDGMLRRGGLLGWVGLLRPGILFGGTAEEEDYGLATTLSPEEIGTPAEEVLDGVFGAVPAVGKASVTGEANVEDAYAFAKHCVDACDLAAHVNGCDEG